MPDIKSIISKKDITGYFILDSKQEGKGGGEYGKEINFEYYLYKPRFFNKLKEGALFLYRLPGGAAVDRKFAIYGGGRIATISEPDEDGNVKATISEGFRFARPVKQGDPIIEEMVWTSRKRKPKADGSGELGWEHTFSQYGMNAITEEEFWSIVSEQNCIAAESYKAGKAEVEEEEFIEVLPEQFTLERHEPDEGKKKRRGRHKTVTVGTHIDYVALQKAKDKIGALAEELALLYIREELRVNGNDKDPVHVSKEEGDGFGYDIRSWDKSGKEIHSEVKGTKSNSQDGFDISPAEVQASMEQGIIYRIIRVYGIDPKKGTAKICVYEGPVTAEGYELIPTGYRAYRK